MKVVINGYAGIQKNVKASFDEELDAFSEEIKRRKAELKEKVEADIQEEVGRIERQAEERAESEFRRGVARARAEMEDRLLRERESQVDELREVVRERLAKVAKAKKQAFVERQLADALKEVDEPVARVDVPAGVSVDAKGANVSAELGELGVVVQTKSGAMVRRSAAAKLTGQELAKVLAKGVWQE